MKKLSTKATVEEIKNFFTQHKGELRRWDCWTTSRPYEETRYHMAPQQHVCPETKQNFIISGIGPKKVNINGYWYSYTTIHKAIQRGYKQNSQTLNSFLCVFFEDYVYEHYNDDDIRSVVSNRKNCQYLLKSEIPKYIPAGYVIRLCNRMELPVISKNVDL